MAKAVKSAKKVTSVFLESETRENRQRLKMFFCPNCRTPIAQYKGTYVTIVPGQHPYEPLTLHKCKGTFKNEEGDWEECGYFYSFVSVVQTKTKVY